MTASSVKAELAGSLATTHVLSGAAVQSGEIIGEIESMKSFWPIYASASGVLTWAVGLGQAIGQDDLIATIEAK